MSPSSSTAPRTETPQRTKTHSRHPSTTTTRLPDSRHPDSSPQQSSYPDHRTITTAVRSPAHYTVFIRLPFQRGDFQDPPLVDWNATKDKALWKLISGGSGTKDINWEDLSHRFNVSISFLLQQAAWLSERHFERMRKQVQRIGASANPVPSPVPTRSEEVAGQSSSRPGSAEATVGSRSGGVTMERKGSRESQKRSSLLSRKSTPLQIAEESKVPPSPRTQRPGVSRTPSTSTVTQSRAFASGSRRPSQTYSRSNLTSKRPTTAEEDDSALGHDGTSESESEDEPSRRPPWHRSPLSKTPPMGTLSSDGDVEDDDDDDSGGFLPFAARPDDEDDPTATLTTPPSQQPTSNRPAASSTSRPQPPDSSASSNTSSQPSNPGPPRTAQTTLSSPDTLSPQQRAQLSRLSPRYRNAVSGSEGSPSMGSSFSDLDDLSVTQSALEEALMSRVQHGGSIGMGLGSLVRRGRGNGGRNGNG
ncbi:uncharacterized protein LTR77_010761 [Saxophila tyrrhenica]|uniref:Autophagy-related protein 29 n=1 Tax=Saxophila tyrrhenica TaxID=1690608 RepID=A0AAV9NUK1_9PEZI|nr:hypothetical protein LTR77_010761 [Saxophila tyrrhenica]